MADIPTLHVDVQRTRRKSLHMVTGRSEHVAFTSPKIGDCLLWLLDQGEDIVRVETGDGKPPKLVLHLESV